MESLANFVFNHQELAMLSMLLVMTCIFGSNAWYKRRNQVPPRWAKIVVLFVSCNAIAFAGFCIGVLASHR